MGEGREGDWECNSCRNRNYAFRSFCNRCKQPRLIVDTNTHPDSKWLPRIGDWICTGCSNNNYASRDKCKKCGEPKEEASMQTIAIPRASLPAYGLYFAKVQGLPGLNMNFQMSHVDWPFREAAKYGLQSTPSWSRSANPVAVPEGWRSGDWLCSCGFHNYSSRTECKECNAPVPSGASSASASSAVSDIYPTLGTKRLASDDFSNEWDNKRLNAGLYMNRHFLANGQQHSYQGFDWLAASNNSLTPGMYSNYPTGNSATSISLNKSVQSPQLAAMPAVIGKGAKQWRDGDWVCSQCDNHNFASRSHCNRCKTPKEASAQPVHAAS